MDTPPSDAWRFGLPKWTERLREWVGWDRPTEQANAFAGASVSRLYADWIHAPTLSADQEIKGDLATLRGRARDLCRNNPHAARFVSLFVENVIGPHGIRLQPRVNREDGEFDRDINDRLKDAWEEWGHPENASVDGRLSWLDIQGQAAAAFARDGEAFIRMVPGARNPFGFALQVIDADQVDHDFNRPPGKGRNEIRMGVEVDAWGAPVGYHVWTSHPQDTAAGMTSGRKREFIPVAQMVHLYDVARPGQTRGVTRFAPVLLSMKMLAGYAEAELVAARTAAAKMGFWVPREGEGSIAAGDSIPMEAAPGTFEFAPAGHTFEAFDPTHPTSAFPDFYKATLRSIAAGLHVSYNTFASDLEGVNYSSIRAGLLSERDVWKRLQVWVSTHLHRRVYLAWMRWALASGALELPPRNISGWRRHVWLPRGWPWVDPAKDITAALLAIRGGLDSRTRLTGEQGRDFEEILADLDRESQLAAEYEVSVSTDSGKSPAPAPPAGVEDAGEEAFDVFALLNLLEVRNGNGTHHGNGDG
jgi:lambda family phage portal protein